MHATGFLDGLVLGLVLALRDEAFSPSPKGSLFADHLAFALVRALDRRAGSPTRIPRSDLCAKRLDRLIEFMRANLSEPVTLAQLVEVVGQNELQMSRAFKVAMGTTPWQYFLAMRIERAAELIASDPDASLAFVAAETGFYDQSHMHRHFRKIVGVTPGCYRHTLHA